MSLARGAFEVREERWVFRIGCDNKVHSLVVGYLAFRIREDECRDGFLPYAVAEMRRRA